jgi:valyl-tRNA synthetase
MLTPFIPHVTEEVSAALFAAEGASLHSSSWPQCDERFVAPRAEEAGRALCQLLRAVRRYKSEAGMSLGTELALLQVRAGDLLRGAEADMASATRAQKVEIVEVLSGDGIELPMEEGAALAVSIALVGDKC